MDSMERRELLAWTDLLDRTEGKELSGRPERMATGETKDPLDLEDLQVCNSRGVFRGGGY